jgi:hypothetical protein
MKPDSNHAFIKNVSAGHTTKEFLQCIALYKNEISASSIVRPELTTLPLNTLSINKMATAMNNSDYIIIEISSLKIYTENNTYYFSNSVKGQETINSYIQSEEEFAQDIQLINSKFTKPVLYIGHIDLNFYDVPGSRGYIPQRTLIDTYIKKYCTNYLCFKDIFDNSDYKMVCEDPHHLNNYGVSLLYASVVEKLATI